MSDQRWFLSLGDDAWVDPDAVLGLKADEAGETIVYLEGGRTMGIARPVAEVLACLERKDPS